MPLPKPPTRPATLIDLATATQARAKRPRKKAAEPELTVVAVPPEEIVERFPTLALADDYAVVAWMLRHPAEVEEYRRRRDQQAEEVRRQGEAAGIIPTPEESAKRREELQRRWAAQQGQDNAPAAG